MRMWLVDPRIMCTKHLGGEHVETHMLMGSIKRQRSISGYIEKGLVEPMSIKSRHDDLAQELANRAEERSDFVQITDHNSPLEFHESMLDYLPKHERWLKVDRRAQLNELLNRCSRCRERYNALLDQEQQFSILAVMDILPTQHQTSIYSRDNYDLRKYSAGEAATRHCG